MGVRRDESVSKRRQTGGPGSGPQSRSAKGTGRKNGVKRDQKVGGSGDPARSGGADRWDSRSLSRETGYGETEERQKVPNLDGLLRGTRKRKNRNRKTPLLVLFFMKWATSSKDNFLLSQGVGVDVGGRGARGRRRADGLCCFRTTDCCRFCSSSGFAGQRSTVPGWDSPGLRGTRAGTGHGPLLLPVPTPRAQTTWTGCLNTSDDSLPKGSLVSYGGEGRLTSGTSFSPQGLQSPPQSQVPGGPGEEMMGWIPEGLNKQDWAPPPTFPNHRDITERTF